MTGLREKYARLSALRTQYQTEAMKRVGTATILENGRALGLVAGRRLLTDDETELTLIYDLSVHTAKPGRSRAIDRYAASLTLEEGAEEAMMLAALREARFSVWRVEGVEEGRLRMEDLLRKGEVTVLDIGLSATMNVGEVLVARLAMLPEFAMTCGAVVPMEMDLIGAVVIDDPGWRKRGGPWEIADDPKFAAALYRAAIDAGVLAGVAFRDPA